MRTTGLAAILAMTAALGCGEPPDDSTGKISTGAAICGQVAPGHYSVNWTKTSGTCADAQSESVPADVSASSDPCWVVAYPSWPMLCPGKPGSVTCHYDAATCSIAVTFDCPGICLGDYTVTITQ